MDLTQLHLQPPQPYGLETDLSSGSYGSPIGIPQLPRSFNTGFDLQSSLIPQAEQQQSPWPQRVLDEVRDLILLLSPDGIVHYVSPSCKAITGFDPTNLEHDQLSLFIQDEDKPVVARELRECVATARPFRCHFRMYQINNSACLLDAYGHPHLSMSTLNNSNGADNQQQPQPQLQPFCHGVFLVCRPYHTQSTQLLDSFLEHKLENIRLKDRIVQLKKEEDSDLQTATQQAKLTQAPSTAAHRPIPQQNKTISSALEQPAASSEDKGFSEALENMDDLDLSQAGAALGEENSSHLSGIELLTGLFLSEGERSQGISTGARQERLFNSANLPELEQEVPSESEPRKKLKGEYKCADCGTSDSPEWRKGPDGPKTLCNACGCKYSCTHFFNLANISNLVRWAKMEKRRQDAG